MFVHKEVKKIARGIAAEAYTQFALDNTFYKAYPNQNQFVARHWKNFIGQARKSLVAMLAGDYPESVKERIMEIYCQDRSLQALDDLKVQGSA